LGADAGETVRFVIMSRSKGPKEKSVWPPSGDLIWQQFAYKGSAPSGHRMNCLHCGIPVNGGHTKAMGHFMPNGQTRLCLNPPLRIVAELQTIVSEKHAATAEKVAVSQVRGSMLRI
jgi:hypothetical protein